MRPRVYDLYCGLGGWSRGFIAEGYDAYGFDIERHQYGDKQYPGRLVLQDVRTIHGSQFRDAACIVGSSPCQEFSYRAMPWKRAKALPPPYLGMELFAAQFRIQQEASEAAGHPIPMVVENVRGAQKWVGRAAWNYGSYYLWGDIPAIMPFARGAQKHNPDGTAHGQGSWFKIADSKNRGIKVPSMNFHDHAKTGKPGRSFQSAAVERLRNSADSFGWDKASPLRNNNSKSPARKAASAMIAEIPFDLACWIARIYKPDQECAA